jgi:protein-tyrosine phosphatase
MHGLEPDAAAAIAARDLRAVCDLRRNAERERHPNPDFGPAVRRFEWDTALESSPIRDREFAGTAAAEFAHATMVRMYQQMPFRLQPRFAGVFEALAHAGDGATIVHCTAGKDRTGVAIALVLSALDVPRDTIIADYVLTNKAVDLRARLVQQPATGAGLAASADPLLALTPTALDAVLAARPDYLLASLDAIEARHGSVRAYVRDELAVPESAIERLRDTLLEDPK